MPITSPRVGQLASRFLDEIFTDEYVAKMIDGYVGVQLNALMDETVTMKG